MEELKRNSIQSKHVFHNWIRSYYNVTKTGFVVSHEIMKGGKLSNDGEYMKTCFVTASEHLFSNFNNSTEINKKIENSLRRPAARG